MVIAMVFNTTFNNISVKS